MNEQKDEIEELSKLATYSFKKYKPETCIERFSYMLIRPPRFLYNESILSPYKQHANKYNHRVHFIPFPLSIYKPKKMRYIVLYLHGNSSSRVQGYLQLSNLPSDVGLACFDFDGCGNRLQKRFISLGKSEAAEVDIAFLYLKNLGLKVVGWGRSMGSISLLLSKECDLLILDSPFSNLKNLCKEVVISQIPCLCLPLFHCFFPCFFGLVNKDVFQKTEMHLQELDIMSIINNNVNRSILFMAGRQDDLVHYSHSERLFEQYDGRKMLFIFEGDHNSTRPIEDLSEVYHFIDNQMQFRVESGLLKSPSKSNGASESREQLIANEAQEIRSDTCSNNRAATDSSLKAFQSKKLLQMTKINS